MYVPFNDIPNHARVWIYQADRPLSDSEVQHAQQRGQQFVEEWAAHGQDLRASVEIKYRHFLILTLDERHHAASGCSIDSSVGFIRSLQETLGKQGQPIDFFNRTLIALRTQDTVELVPLATLRAKLADGTMAPDTRMFNNLVETKAALQDGWLINLSDSWLARYLPQTQAQ